MLAWSHIYLGRIYDIQDQRDQAVNEYRAALTVRDGQADTSLGSSLPKCSRVQAQDACLSESRRTLARTALVQPAVGTRELPAGAIIGTNTISTLPSWEISKRKQVKEKRREIQKVIKNLFER